MKNKLKFKYRVDYVTNSSSSSYIIARKAELSEEQKEEIVKFVEENFLKGEVILTPSSSNQKIKDEVEYYFDDETYEDELKMRLKEGKDIVQGMIHFEGSSYTLGKLYEKLFNRLEKVDSTRFNVIKAEYEY